MKYSLWLLLVVLGSLPCFAFAAPIIQTELSEQREIWKEATFLKDDSRSVTIDQILTNGTAKPFHSLDKYPNFGFYSGAIWSHIELANPSQSAVTTYLEIQSGMLSQIDVYEVEGKRSAPWSDDGKFDDSAKINVTYRIFLKLANPLQEGKAYSLSVNSKVKIGGPFAFTWDKNTANEAIHVNQVAYLANGPKIAYLSSWTGQGTIDFGAAKTFEVIDEAAQRIVYRGDIKLDVTADKEPWSRSNVYSLDFSSFSIPGCYHIHIPTVGSSYSFQVVLRPSMTLATL
ncbi:MAG: hypothetical protein M3Q07_29035 [Pseudobdellovibrionaceae bacterium]|nr:hypothetical protein [Pseudobdellovibrionaceae bacterium]